jgi:hypothetical protein
MPSFFLSRRYRLTPRFNSADSFKRLLVSQTGLACDRAQVEIEIVTAHGGTKKLRFICDTGSDLMVIPVYVARREGIRYREGYPGTLGSSVGGSTRCYYDFVQLHSSLSGRMHRWVCAFADSLQARLIVGRAGFLDDFSVAIQGGHVVVSYPVSLRRFLRHHAARLRSRARSEDEWEPI